MEFAGEKPDQAPDPPPEGKDDGKEAAARKILRAWRGVKAWRLFKEAREQEICVICQDSLFNEEYRQLTNCSHFFHIRCIRHKRETMTSGLYARKCILCQTPTTQETEDVESAEEAIAKIEEWREAIAEEAWDDESERVVIFASIRDAMERHEDDFSVQYNVCCALGNLADYEQACCEENQDGIREAGFYPLIARALELHEDHEVLAQGAFHALIQLATYNQVNRDAMRDAGIIPLIGRHMERHEYDGDVQEKACEALGQACAENNQANQDNIREAGLIARIGRAMERHEYNGSVQYWACCALCNIADQNPANQDAIREAGLLPILQREKEKGTDFAEEALNQLGEE